MFWHYGNQYFQQTQPGIYERDLDGYYKKLDAAKGLQAAVDFYKSMGFDIEPIAARSDLHPRQGKTPHAHANKMDREKPGTSVLIMKLPADPDPLAKYHVAAGRTAYYNHYAVGRFIAAQVAARIVEVSGQDPRSAV